MSLVSTPFLTWSVLRTSNSKCSPKDQKQLSTLQYSRFLVTGAGSGWTALRSPTYAGTEQNPGPTYGFAQPEHIRKTHPRLHAIGEQIYP